ncbi:lipid kinase YegS [Providencia burhodogranariea]|uniref:Probable lipid kinase YegS-like n=1 Tax=Providencia burhodogranariea DSM 19968 TaxID=1141662 RepID=K8WSJ5_9GAMM|nr:lipid kinase YegS [Providencia burhodogranariea]EKT63558.1 lipid kinase [Providencia burhodogranariea DSM 19968]
MDIDKQHCALLILNGKQSANPELKKAVSRLREEGHTIWVRIPWENSDLHSFIDDAIAKGVETIIAGGGDGTINAVSSTLMRFPEEQRPAIGILPLGTANDFATSANIPQDIPSALALAVKGKATAIDIARVNNDAYFMNMATGGFGTRITTETPEALKSALGGAAYVINGFLRPDTLKTDTCKIEAEDFNWEGETLVVAVGNGKQAGGGQQLAPEALIDDGKLNLLIVPARDVIPALLTNLFTNDKNQHLIERTSSWVKISSPHTMIFNLDGEPLSGETFTYELLPEAIHCRLPPQCGLLS